MMEATGGSYSPRGSVGSDGRPREAGARRRAVDIEETFAMLSSVKAHGGPPRRGRVMLTPRSAEACLQEGVDPEELKIRTMDSFWEPGLDPAAQRMRHEAYSKRRHEKMKAVRRAREEVANKGPAAEEAAESFSKAATGEIDTRRMSGTLLEIEQRRLAKVQAKQQREIQQMMEYEIRMAKIREENEKKIIREQERQEQRKREILKHKKQIAEAKRLREQQRRLEEEMEEQARRALAQKQFEKEKELAAKQKREERRRQLEAREAEMVRQQKAEEHKRQTARILARQQAEIQAKMEEMHEQEIARQELLARQKEEKARLAREKRAAIEERIKANFKKSRALERQRRVEFYKRQRENEERRRIREYEEDVAIEERRREAEENEVRRQQVVRDAQKREKRRVKALLAKQAEAEEQLRRVQADRERDQRLRKERRQLTKQARLENVERQRRKDEYRRLKTLKHMQDRQKKTEELLQKRSELLEQRKMVALATKKQRDVILQAMEEAKTKKNWKAASRRIDAAMANNPLDTIGSSGSPPKTSRSRRSRKRAATAKSLPNLHGREAAHEEFAMSQRAQQYDNMAATAGGRFQSDDAGGAAQSRFKSPYEEIQYDAPKRKARQRNDMLGAGGRAETVPAFAHVG